MTCPIPNCQAQVAGPLRICSSHYALVPLPQRQALASYARTRKGGPAHRASFERAVEHITKTLQARAPEPRVKTPAVRPYWED